MLTLSKDTWHYRNFHVWQKYSKSSIHRDLRLYYSEYSGKWMPLYEPRQPDLCTYTRIALIYGPYHRVRMFIKRTEWLKWTLTISLFYLAGFFIGTLIADEQGLPSWFPFVFPFLIVIAIAAMIGFVALLMFIQQKLDDVIRSRRHKEEKKKKVQIIPEYVKAKKRKICPLIDFEEEVSRV